MRVTVACVLWMPPKGQSFEGRSYSPAWVLRLRDQVARNLPIPHDFVCLSNIPIAGVDWIPLVTDWPGWWAKLEIFRPGWWYDATGGDSGRVLYLDLDVFITGDLTPLVTFPSDHADAPPLALMPPSTVFAGLRERNPEGVIRKYQASCIVFDPPEGRELFDEVTPDVMRRYRADQDWIGFRRPDCPTMPAQWFAKLKQCANGRVPPDVRVVLAHRVNLLGRSLHEVA